MVGVVPGDVGGVVPVVPVVPEPVPELPDGVPPADGGVVTAGGVVATGGLAGGVPVSVVAVPDVVGVASLPPPPHPATSADAMATDSSFFFKDI